MKYTAGQAAKAAGVSTATISRALKKGTISGDRSPDGTWRIDPAELHRVYPPLAVKGAEPLTLQGLATPVESAVQGEIATLREALADAKAERDRWREMAERLALAPPHQPAPRRSLWQRITGQ